MIITGLDGVTDLKATCVVISGTGAVDSSKTINVTIG